MLQLITLALVATCAWAQQDVLQYRHNLQRTASQPDVAEFSLRNLKNATKELLSRPGRGRPGRGRGRNPFARAVNCPRNAEFRTINGTCNNLNLRRQGASKTPLARLTPARYQDGIEAAQSEFFSTGGPLPTARQVSLAVLTVSSNESTRHTHLLMSFGQFTDHDVTLSPEAEGEGEREGENARCCEVPVDQYTAEHEECLPILTPNDPVFTTTCIPFLRSAPVPPLPGAPPVRNQLNDLTAYIDSSNVYGSTNSKATLLRSFTDGLLRSQIIQNEEVLPDADDNPPSCVQRMIRCRFIAGDIRNTEQASLTSMHTILLREHNRIAKELKIINRRWDDERLYQETRKIVIAIMQRITYTEWLPQIIGPKLMNSFGLELLNGTTRFNGYSASTDPSVVTEFSTAAFRFGHTLVRQTFSRSASASLDLRDMFDSFKTVNQFGVNGLAGGLLRDRVENFDTIVSNGLQNELFGEEADLFSFNINRGRDHGMGSYNDVRRSLNLTVYSTFPAMVGNTHSMASINNLSSIYPATEDLELFPAGISELPLPGAVVGETFGTIIALQFSRFRRGDRFWHETPIRRIGFTNPQLREIRKASIARLFCDNVPGAPVRRQLFLLPSSSNQNVDCSQVPSIDLSKFRN